MATAESEQKASRCNNVTLSILCFRDIMTDCQAHEICKDVKFNSSDLLNPISPLSPSSHSDNHEEISNYGKW